MNFTSVDIIYNPNSTGPSSDYAKDLSRKLKKEFSKCAISLRHTEYAGHAEKIAYNCAQASKQPFIISVSGDGGYNEVINGAVQAQLEGAQPICAVMPAGNANDHSRTLHDDSLFTLICKGNIRQIDLLKIQYVQNGSSITRYAHSYVGLGLTPVVAVELNKTDLTMLKELWIVLKTFYNFRPFKIQQNGISSTLDSIVFSNIGEMAKVLTVSKNAEPDDGLFEVVKFPHAHKFRLLKQLAKATVGGLEQEKHYNRYQFKVVKKTPMQLDGEVRFIDKNTEVIVSAEHKLLSTFY